MYYSISTSCKFKNRILNLKEESLNLKFIRTQILEQRAQVLEMITLATEVIKYKFVKGDEVDALFGQAMMKHGCKVIVKRLDFGKYMFG